MIPSFGNNSVTKQIINEIKNSNFKTLLLLPSERTTFQGKECIVFQVSKDEHLILNIPEMMASMDTIGKLLFKNQIRFYKAVKEGKQLRENEKIKHTNFLKKFSLSTPSPSCLQKTWNTIKSCFC